MPRVAADRGGARAAIRQHGAGALVADDRAYADMVAREYDLFVCREAHFRLFAKAAGTFDFAQPDLDLAWAEVHRMVFRGPAAMG